MELREYWFIIRKWWWLLVACTLLAAGASFVVLRSIDPTYEASTLLMIGGSIELTDPTTGELQTSEKLAQTYAQLLKTRPIIQATMQTLGLAEEPEFVVSLVSNTQLLRLTVSDTLPARGAATANELANQLILQSPSAPEREERQYREFVQQQLTELQADIAALSNTIVERQENLSPEEQERLQGVLEARRTNYSALLSYLRSSSTNYIQVIEPAVIPTEPARPRVLTSTLLAAIVGLMIAAGVAFLIEYLDDSVKTQADIEQSLGLPALGTVYNIRSRDGIVPESIARVRPDASETEAYRIVDLNLRYSLPADAADRVFLVTSVGPGEGKSTTAANLAAVMAESGQKVILVDADMRRPTLHTAHGLYNERGLSSILVGEVADATSVIRETDLPTLSLLTAGPIPPNAAVLLASDRMKSLLAELAAAHDVLILDSPPIFAAADASILSGIVTGSILVAESGRTKALACAQAAEDLQRLGGRFLGVVLNRYDTPGGAYGSYGGYYGYGSYGYRHYGAAEEPPASRLRTAWKWLQHRARRVPWLSRDSSSIKPEEN